MFNSATLAKIQNSDVITNADRARALAGMTDFFTKIDIWAIERYRCELKLPPEALGLMVSVYVAHLDKMHENRTILPISSSSEGVEVTVNGVAVTDGFDGIIKRNTTATLKIKPRKPFTAQRLFVGGPGGASNWLVDDIKVDGATQFIQSGSIPGDMFASAAIDGFVKFMECRKTIEIIVQYIGPMVDGCKFYGSIIGGANLTADDDETDGGDSDGSEGDVANTESAGGVVVAVTMPTGQSLEAHA